MFYIQEWCLVQSATLVCCKLRLQFKPKHKKKGNPRKKLNVSSLCREEVKAKFEADLQQILDESPCTNDPSPNIRWENLKSARTSEEVFGHTKKKKQRLVRWEQQGDPGQETAINHVPQLPPIVELDERPTLEELTKAIDQLKSRKAAGVDGIPPEIWNYCH